MMRTAESIENKKVWFKGITGRELCGIVEAASDVTGLVWVKTDNGKVITSLKDITAVKSPFVEGRRSYNRAA